MIYVVTILAIVQFMMIIILLYQLHQQKKQILLMMDYQQLLLAHLQFGNDAHEMTLWKIRGDMLAWQDEFVKTENYEMAKETKNVTDIIANMIHFYRNQLKTK